MDFPTIYEIRNLLCVRFADQVVTDPLSKFYSDSLTTSWI